jgi:D-amino-acid dehydrogenase
LEVWRGLRPCTPDGLPLIGRTRQWKNVVIAGGHDTKGLSMGPATGLYVARILAGKSLDGLEKHLTPDRF